MTDLATAVASRWPASVSPVAVVTGAARGIGAATVDPLVVAGWRWWRSIAARTTRPWTTRWPRRPDLEALAARHGDAVRTVVGDVRQPADMDGAVDEALHHFGGLHAAVAVAGVISGGPPLWETDDAQWDVLFDVNVKGVRHLAAAAVPVLAATAAPPRAGWWPWRRPPACWACVGSRLRRVQGGGDRAGAGAGRRPGRHRGHGQRRLPWVDPRRDARCLGRRLRAGFARGVRPAAAGRAPALAGRARRPDRVAVRPTRAE